MKYTFLQLIIVFITEYGIHVPTSYINFHNLFIPKVCITKIKYMNKMFIITFI